MQEMNLEELRKYYGKTIKADDFASFWEEALQELASVPPQPILVPADFTCRETECFDLYFQGVRGARIHAKYLRPITPGPKPCILMFHGYSMDSDGWFEKLPYVLNNMCVAALDCRGQGGGSEDNSEYEGYTVRGHVTRGLQGKPQNMLYRHMFLDAVELAQIVSTFPEVDAERMGTWGGSQGGALSLACSALYGKIKRTVIGYPFLSDFYRVEELGLFENDKTPYSEIGEYFRHFDPQHNSEKEIYRKLSYIDIQNLAPLIKNVTFMTITMRDTICPPSTQFAVFNKLGGKKRLILYKDYGHEFLPYWQDACFTFLKAL